MEDQKEKETSLLTTFDTIEGRDIEWLWEPWIPMEKITVIQSKDPSSALSFVKDFCTMGINSNDKLNAFHDKKILCHFYDGSRMLKLMDAVKTDNSHIRFLCNEMLYVNKELDKIERVIDEENPDIIILDPYQDKPFWGAKYLKGISSYQVMKSIGQIARKYHCAVIIIGHQNQRGNYYKYFGDSDALNTAYSIFRISEEHDENGGYLLESRKLGIV